MGEWTLFSNHGHVLVCLASNQEARLRDVAADVGITERAVQNILRELQAAGMVTVTKHGRCNRYQINTRKALRHPLESHCTVGKLLNVLRAGTGESAAEASLPRERIAAKAPPKAAEARPVAKPAAEAPSAKPAPMVKPPAAKPLPVAVNAEKQTTITSTPVVEVTQTHKAIEKPARVVDEKPVVDQKPREQEASKAPQKTVEKTVEKTVAKPAGKPADKPAAKASKKDNENPDSSQQGSLF